MGADGELGAAISNDMLAGVAIAGPAERCRERIREYRRAGVDMPVIVIPRGAPGEIVTRTLEALAGG